MVDYYYLLDHFSDKPSDFYINFDSQDYNFDFDNLDYIDSVDPGYIQFHYPYFKL